MENKKEVALQWVKEGKLCVYQYGLSYKGAEARVITSEEAMNRLQKESGWSFGMGFYELSWKKFNGEPCLKFNEYSEHDML